MPDVLAIAMLQIALPIFIGHLLLLDFLQWRSTKDRFLFAAAASVLATAYLEFRDPVWRSWFGNHHLAFVFIGSIFVAPIVSVWEAGVLRVFGWKRYSEAFDVTVRINRFLPLILWVMLFSHDTFSQDPSLLMILAGLLILAIQWVGLLAYSKNGSGGSFLQAFSTKLVTYIVLVGLIAPLVTGYSPPIQPLPAVPMFLAALLTMSLVLHLTGWSTLATSTRKSLEICTAASVGLIAAELFGYVPSALVEQGRLQAFTLQFGTFRWPPLIYTDKISNLVTLSVLAAVFLYAFVSFTVEGKVIQRPRLVPSIVCAVVFGLASQHFLQYRPTELTAILIAAIVVPSIVALYLRTKILGGEKALRSGNYDGAQAKLESSLNLLERLSGHKTELTLRCHVGLAEATARQNLFLQASGFVEQALDTVAGGLMPSDEQAIVLQQLAVDLHRKTGLAKTNALKERLEKLIPDIPGSASDTALNTASNGITTSSTLSGSIFGSKTLGNTASDAASSGTAAQPNWNSGTSGGIFGGIFPGRMLARSSDSGIAPSGVFGGVPREAPTDKSLQSVPPRIANLVAIAPTWDKNVKARTAIAAPSAELPGFAITSGSIFAKDNERNNVRAEHTATPLMDPSTESWMRPAVEPNAVSLPTTATWMQVSSTEHVSTEANKNKNASVSFALSGDDGTVSGNDSRSPIEPNASFLNLPSFHKKHDRFDDSSSVFFSWKVWTIKILILVCCPLLLAVSTGLNYLASQNKDLAEACMSSALTIKQVVLGARNAETGHAHQALGEYYLDHEKDDLAYLNLRSALSIFDENNPRPDEEDETKSWSPEDVEKHNELRKKVSALAEGFGDYDAAVLMWQDIEAVLARAQREALRIPSRQPLRRDESDKLVSVYGNDLFRATVQAARLRGVQQQRDEACKLYSAAFQRRFAIADSFYVPTKYSIDWTRKVDSPEFYLEAARAAMNYSMVRDSMGNKDKSFIARRMAHLFATRYLQERILKGINKSKEMVSSCNTAHDTKIAVSVFADGQLSNLRVQSAVGPSCCDHRCLMAIQNGFGLNESGRLGLSIPVELVCPVDVEFGFRNKANIFGYGAHHTDEGFTAYIP